MNFNCIISLQSQTVIANENNWSSTFGMVGQFFFLILVFVGILILAYYVTKWFAGMRMGARGKSDMEIIYALPVSSSANIQLVKIGKKYFLLGVTKENISFLAEIDEEDVPKKETKETNNFSFEKCFREYFDKKKK